jgi:hypothetical protein
MEQLCNCGVKMKRVLCQKDRCESCHSFSNIVIVIHLVKRVAGEPIHVGSQIRRRIFNSESNSDNEEQEEMQTQNVVQQMVEAVVVETSTTAASTTSRKRFAILDSTVIPNEFDSYAENSPCAGI